MAPRVEKVDPRAVVLLNRTTSVYNPSGGLMSPQYYAGRFGGYGATFLPDEVKHQMCTDAKVSQAVNILKTSALSDSIQVVPSHDHNYKEHYEKSVQVRDFFAWCLSNTSEDIFSLLWQLTDCVRWCNMVGNWVFTEPLEYGEYKGKVGINWLQMLPRFGYQFYVSNGMKIEGVSPTTPMDSTGKPKIWPRDKFAVCIFRPTTENPFGTDVLGAAYLDYYLKLQGKHEGLANLVQFGSPTSVATGPEDAIHLVERIDSNGNPVLDSDGQPIMISPQASMREGMEQGIGNGRIVILPGTATLKFLEAQNGGDVFRLFEDNCNDAIVSAILGTDKLTERGNRESSGSLLAGESVVGLAVTELKYVIEGELNRLARTLTEINYGPQWRMYAPRVDLGSGLPSQASQLMNSSAALFSVGGMTRTQLDMFLNKRCGVDLPNQQELEAEMARADASAEAKKATGNANGNAAGTSPKTG